MTEPRTNVTTRRRLDVPGPPPNWWLWSGVLAVLVGLLLTSVLVPTWPFEHEPGTCGHGVDKVGGECVGVSDGGYPFPGLEELSARIHAENQRVEESGAESVAIAYLEPLSGGAGDRGVEAIREAVAGAHLAQLKLNRPRDTLPRVRLLLANTGRDDGKWEHVVDELIADKDKERLVAVTGLGQSNDRTVKAVRKLRAAGVPMVGATVAGTDFASRRSGFFRVSSPAGDQAAAAVRHFKERQDKDPGYRIQVVKDIKNDDAYNRSLYEGFTKAAAKAGLKLDKEIIPYSSGPSPGTGNDLWVVADKVCRSGSRPDALYFAGRGRQVRRFIEAAGENRRSCPVTLLSGSSTVGVYFDTSTGPRATELDDLDDRWTASGLKVYYTAYTHPRLARELYGGGRAHSPYAQFEELYRSRLDGSPAQLADGQAMLGHDAVYTAGVAAVQVWNRFRQPVTAERELEMLSQTNGDYAVRGVTGSIAFDPDTWEPVDRPLALVELRPPGAAGERYRYVKKLVP